MTSGMYFAIVLMPLLAAVLGGLLNMGKFHGGVIRTTCFFVTVSALLSVVAFIHVAVLGHPGVETTLYNWLDTDALTLNFGVLVDKLTVTMMLVVTVVSACVHYYSIGYMEEDPDKGRFFSYLSFFTFTMLALVSAPNLAQMFLGWEGVGVASYLLIGFWFKKESANAAAIKAFLVNRVADVGLLLAMFTCFAVFGTLNFNEIFAKLPEVTGQTYSFFGYDFAVPALIAFLLFIGAMGKSAQFGFHTWLPDAMEGPTPVSALIHAATMVTAGVFLLSRMSPMFELSGGVLTFVAWIGAITAVFAATIGLVQNDIKRVIAYSTCSQLGYMFFACGVSAYSAAMFHLTTHAFFKALLFLGAGAVIHGMHHEQDMRKMGGLKIVMPITYILMWVGSLALMGVVPFAGFFSKDLILESALMSGTEVGTSLYVFGTLAALMTAFYSCRVMFMAFHGKVNGDPDVMRHAHDAPGVMLLPMLLLAVGALFSGLVLHSMGEVSWWDGAIVVDTEAHPGIEGAHHTPWMFKYLPLLLVFVTSYIALIFYVKKPDTPKIWAKEMGRIYKAALNRWYIDEIYNAVIVKPCICIANTLWQRGDVNGIDKMGPNGMAWFVNSVAKSVRVLQSGFVYHYAFIVVMSVCGLIVWLMI